jgi:hypothetical protein
MKVMRSELWLLVALVGCAEPAAPIEDESVIESSVIQNPTIGGPYGNLTTYKCSSRSTAHCYSVTGGDALSFQIDQLMNNAATNWGCGGRVPDGSNITIGEYAGSREFWYTAQNGSWYGCLVIWNVKRQAAYVMIQGDATHAANAATSTKLVDRYWSLGFRAGVLGYPTSNATPFSGGTTYQQFEYGVITYWSGAPTAYYAGGRDATSAALVAGWKAAFGVSTTSGPTAYGFTQDIDELATNWALPANGGTATASSTYAGYQVNAINDGKREAVYSTTSTYWNNANSPPQDGCWYANGQFPWAKVSFSQARTINRINVFSPADGTQGNIPTTDTTGASYGLLHFRLQYCPAGTTCLDTPTGGGWVEPAGGAITYNNKARRGIAIPDVSATAVRVVVNCAAATWARVAELEALGGQVGKTATYWDSKWGYKGYALARDGATEAPVVTGPIAARWDQLYNRVNTLGGMPPLGMLGTPTTSLETLTKNLVTGMPFYGQRFEGGLITFRPSGDGYVNYNCYGAYTANCNFLNGGVTGSRYDQYFSAGYITNSLPTCASLLVYPTAYKPWEPCRDSEGNLSDVGSTTAGAAFQNNCRATCSASSAPGTRCNDPNGSPSTCGLFGVYANACNNACTANGGLTPTTDCNKTCTGPAGQGTTCGAQGLCVAPPATTPPPLCSERCTTTTSCNATCRSSPAQTYSDTTCGAATGFTCKSAADFVETITGPRFRFTLSSPIVSPACFGDQDNDCLEDLMENQLAAMAAPRVTYDEDENCGGGMHANGTGQFYGGLKDAPGGDDQAKVRHCGRVDFFQVRPLDNGTPVSQWSATDGKQKSVVVRFFMAYPFQRGGKVAGTIGFPGHYGDLEWIEVTASGLDLRAWTIDRIVMSHHGPTHSAYSSTRTYAEHMARMARYELHPQNQQPIMTINADEDSHGSWSGVSGGSSKCEGSNDNLARDCIIGTLRDDVRNNNFSWVSVGNNNFGGTHAPERLVAGRWSDWGNRRATVGAEPNWTGPGGSGTQNRWYVRYDSEHGPNDESLVDTDNTVAGTQAPWHERFAGWKCATRNAQGNCVSDPDGLGATTADGDCFRYRTFSDPMDKGEAMQLDGAGRAKGYCYTLWGAQARDRVIK